MLHLGERVRPPAEEHTACRWPGRQTPRVFPLLAWGSRGRGLARYVWGPGAAGEGCRGDSGDLGTSTRSGRAPSVAWFNARWAACLWVSGPGACPPMKPHACCAGKDEPRLPACVRGADSVALSTFWQLSVFLVRLLYHPSLKQCSPALALWTFGAGSLPAGACPVCEQWPCPPPSGGQEQACPQLCENQTHVPPARWPPGDRTAPALRTTARSVSCMSMGSSVCVFTPVSSPDPAPAGDGAWDVGLLNKILLCAAERGARGPSQPPAGGGVVPFPRWGNEAQEGQLPSGRRRRQDRGTPSDPDVFRVPGQGWPSAGRCQAQRGHAEGPAGASPLSSGVDRR